MIGIIVFKTKKIKEIKCKEMLWRRRKACKNLFFSVQVITFL